MQEHLGIPILDCPICERVSIFFDDIGNWQCSICNIEGNTQEFIAIYPLISSINGNSRCYAPYELRNEVFL